MTGNYSPYNREPLWNTGFSTDGPLYNLTATLNKLRNHAISIDSHYVTNHSKELYLDGSTYGTRKGPEGVQIVSVFSNQGSKGGKYQLALPGGFAPGTEAMEVLSCTKITANSVGNITVEMGAGEPKVFFPVMNLNNSGLCGFEKKSSSSSDPSDSKNGSDSGSGRKPSAGDHVSVPLHTVLLGSVLFAVASWFL